MEAKKTESGTWSVSVYLGKDASGRRIRRQITKLTKREAEAEARRLICSAPKIEEDLSVYDAVKKYIAMKAPVLSPSTVRGYEKSLRNQIHGHLIAATKLSVLTSAKVQRWIAEIAPIFSQKTVRNAYGLLTASVALFAPDLRIHATLPRQPMHEVFTPVDEDVASLLRIAREKDPIMLRVIILAANGLRKSEIMGLRAADINRTTGAVVISRAVVSGPDGWVVKSPKTASSYRVVYLPLQILDIFPNTGMVVPCSPTTVSYHWQRLRAEAGVEIRLHDLRHYSASVCESLGVSTAFNQKRHGWSSSYTMRKHYVGVLSDEEKKDNELISAHFAEVLKASM